jgi:hypothetical protein
VAAWVATAWATTGLGGLATSTASADNLFDFTHDPIDPARNNPPLVAGFTPAPFLTDANAAAVGTFLAGQPGTTGQGAKAVKIQLAPVVGGLSLYGNANTRPKYTFMDFEGANAPATAGGQRTGINTASGGMVASNQIFVGNFNIYPVPNDPTRPSPAVVTTASSFQSLYSAADYFTAGLNMANEALYPGAPDLRNPASGNSTAPNIRSALMMLPITRMSLTTANLPSAHRHIPYVNRFNNFGNLALDTNRNAADGFAFVPGQAIPAAAGLPALTAAQTTDQMLSRGDFKAMIAHYRARGADGVHLLDGGVVGYTRTQFESDAKEGWEFAPFASIFSSPLGGAALATLDTMVRTDSGLRSIEDAGLVYSGVYSLSQNKLALLVSNLSETPQNLQIQNKIGGKSVALGALNVLAGQHKLLEFTGVGTQWQLTTPGGTAVFVDNDRSGTGVPEPAVLGTVALAGLMGLGRRRRRA